MPNHFLPPSRALRALAVVVALSTACTDAPPTTSPIAVSAANAAHAAASVAAENAALATIRGATARYHDIQAALDDGFVLLHECETRPGSGAVGTVYVHIGRLVDGVIDPASPDALIYEPQANGRLTLVGAEFAIPTAMWNAPQPPAYFGHTFQEEGEFGVFALHAWVWRHNPMGMYGEVNPAVSCLAA